MTDLYRILISGTRDTTSRQDAYVAQVLHVVCCWAWSNELAPLVVHGAARGVDDAAKRAAIDMRADHEPHPADWNTHGEAADRRRNQEMVDLGARICLAFPGPQSVGTWDCIRRATKAGIHVRIYPLGGSDA